MIYSLHIWRIKICQRSSSACVASNWILPSSTGPSIPVITVERVPSEANKLTLTVRSELPCRQIIGIRSRWFQILFSPVEWRVLSLYADRTNFVSNLKFEDLTLSDVDVQQVAFQRRFLIKVGCVFLRKVLQNFTSTF